MQETKSESVLRMASQRLTPSLRSCYKNKIKINKNWECIINKSFGLSHSYDMKAAEGWKEDGFGRKRAESELSDQPHRLSLDDSSDSWVSRPSLLV